MVKQHKKSYSKGRQQNETVGISYDIVYTPTHGLEIYERKKKTKKEKRKKPFLYLHMTSDYNLKRHQEIRFFLRKSKTNFKEKLRCLKRK